MIEASKLARSMAEAAANAGSHESAIYAEDHVVGALDERLSNDEAIDRMVATFYPGLQPERVASTERHLMRMALIEFFTEPDA